MTFVAKSRQTVSYTVKTKLNLILLGSALCASAYASVCNAADCENIDPESRIAELLEETEGKVLKVEETIDPQGCVELQIRILIDGTVKAVTIKNQSGA